MCQILTDFLHGGLYWSKYGQIHVGAEGEDLFVYVSGAAWNCILEVHVGQWGCNRMYSPPHPSFTETQGQVCAPEHRLCVSGARYPSLGDLYP